MPHFHILFLFAHSFVLEGRKVVGFVGRPHQEEQLGTDSAIGSAAIQFPMLSQRLLDICFVCQKDAPRVNCVVQPPSLRPS